ncbi:hypothetical protein AAFC00_007169 [Neodothiora populina]|uniref:BTB domain-containing protein n=1 Tax=Neodothiora populina TaxID=2781224 RepID=A0ABR3PHF3_9PEZI
MEHNYSLSPEIEKARLLSIKNNNCLDASIPGILPPSILQYTPFVKVIVSTHSTVSPEQSFDIHTGLLAFYSPYFLTRLVSDPPVVHVEEEVPNVVDTVYSWLYTSVLFDHDGTIDEALPGQLLAEIWKWADKHEMPALMNRVCDVFFERMEIANLMRLGDAKDTDGLNEVVDIMVRALEEGSLLQKVYEDVTCALAVRDRFMVSTGLGVVQQHLKFWTGEGGEGKDSVIGGGVVSLLNEFDAEEDTGAFESQKGLLRLHKCAYHKHPDGVKCPEE